MKKVMALLLAGVMALSVPAAASFADDGKEYKVAMICDSSINDGGWGAACYNAMVAAADENGWTYEVSDNIGQNEYYDSIAAYCALGYDMIYAPGNQYTDAVLQAAEEYPDIAFALLNGADTVPGEAVNGNVTSLLPNAQQIGWIAGALAGLMTKSGTIAFIGGMELDTTLGKYAGYGEAAFCGGKFKVRFSLLENALYFNCENFDKKSAALVLLPCIDLAKKLDKGQACCASVPLEVTKPLASELLQLTKTFGKKAAYARLISFDKPCEIYISLEHSPKTSTDKYTPNL